jgi:hypothetical protein
MLNKVISIADGFMMGFCVMSIIMTSNILWGIPLMAGIVIIVSNFTGFGE